MSVFRTVACAGALLAASCGGDGVIDSSMGTMPPTGTVSLNDVQTAVFTPSCAFSGCHLDAAAPFGLDLSDGRSFGNLVNVPSAEVPTVLRVSPGRPTESYLYLKLIGDPSIAFDRMPLIGGPLPADRIELVRIWIEEGANP